MVAIFDLIFLTIFNYLAVKNENEIKNEPKMMQKMATVNGPNMNSKE